MLEFFGYSLCAVVTEHGEKVELGFVSVFRVFPLLSRSGGSGRTVFGGGCAVMLFGVPMHHGEQSVLCFFGSVVGHVAPNDRANSKKHQISSRGSPRPSQGNVSKVAPVSGRLVARYRMHTVVAVNTVNRAAMGAEQGIATLTRKKPATCFFACSRHFAGQRFRQHTFQKTPRRMHQQNFHYFQISPQDLDAFLVNTTK